MKIIFMGTPDFAVPSLAILVENGYEIVGVITAPDRPAGRGQKLSQSAIKKYALSQNLPVLQPKNLKSRRFLAELASLKADLQVVVAFRMLPAAVFEMPPLGCVNLHGSLLPQYRGAAPINHAVMNGEKETGVTTFFIEQKIDTGKVIFQSKTAIGYDESAGKVHDRLMVLGADLMLKTVKAIDSGDYPQVDQGTLATGELKLAHKIFKENCRIDWSKSTQEIHDFVRGLSPYPAAFTTLNGKTLKVFKTHRYLDGTHGQALTSVMSDGKKTFRVATKDGFVAILELQLQGKKRMKTEDFLRGYKQGLVIE